MDLGLKDKRAFVAASTRGLGYATALVLAQEGCRVAVNGREQDATKAAAEKISAATGVDAFPAAGDVTDPVVPAKLIEQDKVVVILGPSGTGASMAIRGDIDRASMPNISMAGGSP